MISVWGQENLPKLDLHGENREITRILVKNFLEDNYKLGNMTILIVHGIGEGILKKEVHKVLRNDKKVKEYGLDMFNPGCTVVKLTSKLDITSKKCYNMQHNVKGE